MAEAPSKWIHLDEFHRPPPEIAALEREDLEALDRILSKLAR
jgi:hypothetical protein